jgi:hypothetical protein
MLKIKVKIGRYHPYALSGDTWGIIDSNTGELLKKGNRLERYPYQWAAQRCLELNRKD